ncbi:MAG: hypothetical protein ACYC3I_16815 [Gemmataceae bacterium]
MSFLLVCPCGKRWMSEEGSAIPCPDCGRPLASLTGAGWRSLWPRLTLAAVATTLVVLVAAIALIRLLPSSPRATMAESEAAPNKLEESAFSPPTPEKPLLPLLDPSPPSANATLPLLDHPLSLAPPLESPSRTRAAKSMDPPPKSVPDPQVKNEFFQHLVISRVSRYRILDLDMGQNVQYILVSRFRTKKKSDDGGMVVEQKVEGVRLSNADPALQERLNELLQKTKGATFTMTLNARREVTKFEGDREAIEVFTGGNPLGGPSFLLWSFLDRDGWKELAELSFFQPPSSIRRSQRWDRPMTHTWGPLGNWSGKIHFQSTGKQDGFDRFDYLLDLAYKPPEKGGALPFAVGKSQFQIQTASGALAYQPSRKRIAAAEERFHVRGQLTVSFLGVESSVQMDEMQVFQLRIVDKNPLEP